LRQYANGLDGEARLRAVMGQQLRLRLGRLRKALLQRPRDARMLLLPLAAQQGAAGHLLHQRMLEGVAGGGWWAAPQDQPGFEKPGHRVPQLVVAHRGHRRQQLVRELAADAGAGLGHLLDERQAIQPRQQRIVEGRGNRERRQRAGQLVAVARVPEEAGLEHRLGQLLDEQRHAVGLGHELRGDLVRQGLSPDDPVDQSGALTPAQPPQREGAYLRATGPRRRKLRSKRDDGQHRQALRALHRQAQELLSGRVDPLHVLVHHQHRLLRRQPCELIQQRFERQLLLALRRQVQRRVAFAGRNPEQRRDQRHGSIELVRAAGQEALELGEPRLGRIVALETGGALQAFDQRVQRTGLVIGGALVGKSEMGLGGDALAQLAHQARLANPRLAREQHHLALALARLAPAAKQQGNLLLAPDQRGQARSLTRLEAVLDPSLARDPPDRERLGKALQALRPDLVELEQPADQSARRVADHDSVRRGQHLHPRGKVRHVADHDRFAGDAFADQVTHHRRAGSDTHPDP
jgi:hypothetical protein